MVRGDTGRGWQRWLRTQSSTPSHCTSPAHAAPGKRYNTAELLMHIVLRQFCCEHRMCFIPTNYLVSPTVYYARSPSQLTIVCQLLTLLCLLFQQSQNCTCTNREETQGESLLGVLPISPESWQWTPSYRPAFACTLGIWLEHMLHPPGLRHLWSICHTDPQVMKTEESYEKALRLRKDRFLFETILVFFNICSCSTNIY